MGVNNNGTRFADIQAVLFDLDGTLIDSAPDLGASADLMRLQRGLPALDLAAYRPMAGAGAGGMLAVAFGVDASHAEYGALRQEFFAHYEQRLTHSTTVFAGVAQLLQELAQRGMVWGVVTNKIERFTLPLTRAMPLFASAGTIISGDTTRHPKPHPLPLLEAARRLGVLPQQCVYVGDDKRDIQAGLAADMKTVVANYGYLGQAVDPSQWGAHASINSAFELLQLLA